MRVRVVANAFFFTVATKGRSQKDGGEHTGNVSRYAESQHKSLRLKKCFKK